MIKFVKKTLQLELDDFSKIASNPNITKQAFSQARQKVSPKAFIHMLNQVNKWYYKDTPFEKWYLAGKFGGLPQIKNLKKSFTNER